MKWKTNKKLRTYVVVGLFFTQLVSLNPLGGTFHQAEGSYLWKVTLAMPKDCNSSKLDRIELTYSTAPPNGTQHQVPHQLVTGSGFTRINSYFGLLYFENSMVYWMYLYLCILID